MRPRVTGVRGVSFGSTAMRGAITVVTRRFRLLTRLRGHCWGPESCYFNPQGTNVARLTSAWVTRMPRTCTGRTKREILQGYPLFVMGVWRSIFDFWHRFPFSRELLGGDSSSVAALRESNTRSYRRSIVKCSLGYDPKCVTRNP